MNKIAEEWNKILETSVAGRMLSRYGRELYFPKGIVAQAAEAGKLATTFNATVGMAYLDGEPMILPTIQDNLPRLTPSEAVGYAPTAGDLKLRNLWKEELLRKNPLLVDEKISLPAVVPGITNGLSQAADLFADDGDLVLIPDLCWDNYPLIFETRRFAKVVPYRMFTPEGAMDTGSIPRVIKENGSPKKALVVLNFPHNPTGYTPVKSEALALADQLTALAQSGMDLAVICDDAYFGLFYDEDVFRQSLFGLLHDAHENLLAIKIDGATKEDYVWGFRVGFITLAARGMTEAQFQALDGKVNGAIRATISSSSRVGQTLLYKELSSLIYHGIKVKYAGALEERFRTVKKLLETRQTGKVLRPLPFNSGYFMCFELQRGNAEELRKHLLKNEGIGTIALGEKYLRIAYASVDTRDIKSLYSTVFRCADELYGKD